MIKYQKKSIKRQYLNIFLTVTYYLNTYISMNILYWLFCLFILVPIISNK